MTESRRVGADAVITVYCQAELLRLAAGGMPHSLASDAAFDLFRHVLWTGARMTVTVPERRVGVPVNCLAGSAAGMRDALGMSWDFVTEHHGPLRPSVVLDEDTISTLRWLADAVHRVANGVPPLDAACQAYARAQYWPRRKRKPADPAWLTDQITGAQRAAWAAMVKQKSWPLRLPAEPPAATVATNEGGDAV